MTLRKKFFHEICDQFPVTRAFLTVRAMQRRAHFKRQRMLILQYLREKDVNIEEDLHTQNSLTIGSQESVDLHKSSVDKIEVILNKLSSKNRMRQKAKEFY
jgi:hypothetical protein